MFVNYFGDGKRRTPINLGVARIVLGCWLVRKTVWYQWGEYVSTPYRAALYPAYGWAIPVSAPWLLTVEKWLLIVVACLFMIGYRTRVTASISMLLTAHLGTVRNTLTSSGDTESLFIGAMFLLFFALYAEYDRLSVDEIRRAAGESTGALADRLNRQSAQQYELPALKYSLLAYAVIFFGSGVDKIIAGSGFGFAAADNLARIMTLQPAMIPELQSLVFEFPILLSAAGWGTLVMELGFLIVVLTGASITLVSVAIIGFTVMNAALLSILFLDTFAFIGVFFAYDRVLSRLALDREIDLLFDDRCRFCMQVLLPFKHMDANRTVSFHGRQDVPATYRQRDDLKLAEAMYVVADGEAYRGYYAFVELFRQFRVFLPLVWLMERGVVSAVGERVYQYVAENRARHFTCGAEAD